jgi:hypothetical protein
MEGGSKGWGDQVILNFDLADGSKVQARAETPPPAKKD